MDKRIKNAIARIDTEHQGQTGRGTGFLVGANLVLTAMHVVGNRQANPPEPFDGPIRLTFRDQEPVLGEIVAESMDGHHDWALVRCDAPAGLEPIPIWMAPPAGARWENFGFPDTNPYGLAQSGHIEDEDARLIDAPVLQLFSKQAAAGRGAKPSGWSGSPVTVDGRVVGLLRFALMGDGRSEAGTLYACPISLVHEKYAAELLVADETPELDTALRISDYLIELEPGAFHVLVVHRPADSTWAHQLVARLEGVGLRVSSLARSGAADVEDDLVPRLANSRMALVLCSEAWQATVAWRDETDAILSRAVGVDGFRAGLVRTDESPAPDSWRLAPHFDFSEPKAPVGPEFDRLQFAVAGRVPPAAGSAPHEAFRVETTETGALLETVRDSDDVLAEWQKWRADGHPLDTAALIVGEALFSRGKSKDALAVLEFAHDGVRAQQLKAMALSDAGQLDEAIELLEQLQATGHLDAETGGILGGRYKKLWQQTGDPADLEKAYRCYATAFELTRDFYPGINAAAMALRMGNAEESKRIADEVRGELVAFDHWTLATEAEAQLLSGEIEAARAGYASAVARIPREHRSIASMRRQARENLVAQERERDALDDAFPLSRPVFFSGHMTDVPGRATPRFPEERAEAVRAAIRRSLDAHDIVYGFSSAARGADLLFLEELLDRGGSAEVVLPFPLEDFVKTSVGDAWAERCRSVLGEGTEGVSVRVLCDSLPAESDQPAAYARVNDELQDKAVDLGGVIDESPLMICVWDGADGEAGGTASAVRRWRELGFEVEQIDIRSL